MELDDARVSGTTTRASDARPVPGDGGSEDVPAVPRRGTPAFRRWMLSAVTIGLLPILALASGVGSMRADDAAAATGDLGMQQLSGTLAVVQVLIAVVAFIALLDPRTRFSGAATLVLTLVFNIWVFSLLPLILLGGA